MADRGESRSRSPRKKEEAEELVPASSSTDTAKGGQDQCLSNDKYTRQGNPERPRLTGREKPFQELGDLTALYDGLSAKTRQHVNPLAEQFQVPTPAPDWSTVFADPTLPLQIDVGCGPGRFVLIRAQRLAGRSAAETVVDDDAAAVAPIPSPTDKATANVLGMEIRQKLVTRAQEWAKRLNLRNCGFIFTNATVSWKSLLASYPGPIELVTMQFPDPHFKVKHHKRRHVQPRLVKEMAETMKTGAKVLLQGDVPEVIRWMRDMMEIHGGGCFDLCPENRGNASLSRDEWESPSSQAGEVCKADDAEMTTDKSEEAPEVKAALRWSADLTAGWLPENPLGVPTEREVYVTQTNSKVYRVMLLRI